MPLVKTHPLLRPGTHPVVGHRGNCAHAPENTLESFRQAIALGVDALEFDVRVTSDGTVVVFHDATLERTTGTTGVLAEVTFDEVRRLDAGATFSRDGGRTTPYRGLGIGVPSLRDVLESLPDVPVLIELKVVAAAEATRAVIEQVRAERRCVVASFQSGALRAFQGGPIAVSAQPAEVVPLALPALLGRRFTNLPFDTMSLPRWHHVIPVPLGALARAAAPAGVTVHAWTINDARVARRLWRAGVSGILSDDPATILAERSRTRFDR